VEAVESGKSVESAGSGVFLRQHPDPLVGTKSKIKNQKSLIVNRHSKEADF